ncbi:MAG TPA: GIY-YIG nuclease family protein [Stellaceae bacterium]|nr:GIY-YIG nuclease family protein [Stellaceae bacterium]
MPGGWVYIMTNRPNGALYVGVTGDLARRAWEHREGVADGFTKRYGLKQLVFAERHDDIRVALQREKNMKHWPRAWKVRLIRAETPIGSISMISWRNDGSFPPPSCPALRRASTSFFHRAAKRKPWMAGTSPAMTGERMRRWWRAV